MRRVLVVVAVALALAPHALGDALPLATRLANALSVRGNSPAASAAIALDLTTGRVLFTRHADLPLAPASNEKLTVAFAALHDLGADYRFRTEVLARGYQDGAVWHGDVYLKGFGDPTLTGLQLDRLATQVADAGIARIDGRVLADESWFDAVRDAPGWKPGFLVNECPPLSALVANRALFDRHVTLDPAAAAAALFKQLLRRHGVASGAVSVGTSPDDAYALAQVESAPLSDVLATMDRDSDNFIAEMLLKDLGAEIAGAGTTAAGLGVVTADLTQAGVPLAGVRLADGSGLSLLDRLTARALASLLVAAWDDPDLQPAFWQSLPIAGISGTLEDRMERRPARGTVRAKTGTTDRASALSGFVGDRYAFAVLQNGWPVSWTAARRAQDRFATALAASAAGQ